MVSSLSGFVAVVFALFSIVSQCVALPAVEGGGNRASKSVFCSTVKASWLCPRAGRIVPDVETSIGVARGVLDGSAVRFAVKYASAERWRNSEAASIWELPNGSTNVAEMPLGCPQDGSDSSSEDCLSMVLYVPASAQLSDQLPVLVWIHGGSFMWGSASDPGLDGSKLATATNSIVAVIQYRLGVLGFMAPDGNTNLAVKDVINALSFLQTVAPSFGGHPSKITISGQSSGANMVRALLAVPSASSKFKSAIMHSDPMNYGFLSSATQTTLQAHFNSLISCSEPSCWNSLSLEQILNAQADLTNAASTLDASTGQAQPIRPVRDNSLITTPLDSTDAFPSVNKPIMVTTVKHEAAATIYQIFDTPIPEPYFEIMSDLSLGEERTAAILESDYYPLSPDVDTRIPLEVLGTDQIWRCPSWTFARNWVAHGGNAYVGLFTLGQVYDGNEFAICHQDGSVCHQADIEIVFGTVQSPTAAQSALISEVQKRYRAFLSGGTPNAFGLSRWSAAGSENVRPFNLGGSAAIETGACDPTFWGAAVPFDYQVYGI